jgi:hypothetical protein
MGTHPFLSIQWSFPEAPQWVTTHCIAPGGGVENLAVFCEARQQKCKTLPLFLVNCFKKQGYSIKTLFMLRYVGFFFLMNE